MSQWNANGPPAQAKRPSSMPDLNRIGDRVTRELVKALVAGRHEVVSNPLIHSNLEPFILACTQSAFCQVEALLADHWADPNALLPARGPMLHLACELQQVGCARLLISAKADCWALDARGNMPLSYLRDTKVRDQLIDLKPAEATQQGPYGGLWKWHNKSVKTVAKRKQSVDKKVQKSSRKSKHDQKEAAVSRAQMKLLPILQQSLAEGTAHSVFKEFDADNSNAVDVKEFISKLVSKLKDELALPMTEAEMESAFDGIDADGNGMINFAEFRNWVGKAKKALTHL